MSDEFDELDVDVPSPPARKVDSLAAVGHAVQGSERAQRVIIWVLGALVSISTGVMGWFGAKMDTRLEMQATLALRAEMVQWNADRVRDNAQIAADIRELRDLLLSQDVNNPGKVPQVEKGVWLAFRALAEVWAMTLAGEAAKARTAKQTQGARFARSFDSRAGGRPPQAVYTELVEGVAVP